MDTNREAGVGLALPWPVGGRGRLPDAKGGDTRLPVFGRAPHAGRMA